MSQRATDPKQTVVEWPHVSVSSSATDNDLGPPLEQLLQDLGIKGTPEAVAKAQQRSTALTGGLPVSVSIIEAGATAASKGWAAVVAALGGGTAIWGAATDFWNGQTPGTRGTLAIAAAVVIAACALGVALIMFADVRARGHGAAAQYRARASIASEFLRGATAVMTMNATSPAAPPASATQPDAGGKDGLSAVLAEVKTAQQQVSGVNDVAQQILQTGSSSDDIQNTIVALALAQAGEPGVPVVLKAGGSGHAKRLIRSADGNWKFLLDNQTWMPISEIACFGSE